MALSDIGDITKAAIQVAFPVPGAGNDVLNLLAGVSTALTVSAARTFTGGVTVTTTAMTITDVNVVLSATTGTQIGTAVGQKVAFHGSAPVAQRAGAAQATVAVTQTQTTAWGFATSAQLTGFVALVNELQAALVEKGLIKGSA